MGEIMANVEQKMECLDAIGKHNNRWEKRISNDIPNIDMNGLVSDLNQFLNTTKKDLMTPKSKRKQEIQQAKQQVVEESKQMEHMKQMKQATQVKDERDNSSATKQKEKIKEEI